MSNCVVRRKYRREFEFNISSLAQSPIASLSLEENFEVLSMSYKVRQGLAATKHFSRLPVYSGTCQADSHTGVSPSAFFPQRPACLTSLFHSAFCFKGVISERPPLATQSHIELFLSLMCKYLPALSRYSVYFFFFF